jgi:hypothetical protein
MSHKLVLNLFAFALLIAVALLGRAPVARAETVPDLQTGAKSPSVVMQAFRQGQVGSGTNRAALVIRYGDGSVQTRCVRFEEPEIGGDELLERSGLNPVFGLSLEVCSINGEGCPSDNCFCQCPFPNCEYWAYYHWQGNAWQYSDVGASGYGVRDGTLEGWSWGPGNFSQGTPPPVMTFDQICNPPIQASPTPTTAPQSGSPVIVSFIAQPDTIQVPGCATLSWSVANAAAVLLEGVSVGGQGTQQVCPQTTQSYTLIAASAVGQQVSQQVTVQVTSPQAGAGQGAATPTATVASSDALPTPAWTPPLPDVVRSGMPTPAYLTSLPVMPQGPQPVYPPGQAGGGFPAPDPNFSPLALPEMVGGVPFAPTADPAALDPFLQAPQGPLPTATRFVFARPPTETPRPRRILGQDGRATPTPILVARAGGAPGSGAAATEDLGASPAGRDGNRTLAASRAFNDALLPQYAGYLATLTILLAMGWLVQRRRNGHPSAVVQPARDSERKRDDWLAGRDERAAQ